MKKLIAVVFTTCALIGSAAVAYAEEEIEPKLEINMPPVSTNPKQVDTHKENTPMWDDELTAVVTYDTDKIKADPVITWYRFNNHAKYDENGEKIADSYYEVISQEPIYRVLPEDIGHMLKVEVQLGDITLIKETEPVDRRDYGEVRLNVVDNTNYGDTDGYIGLLDTRMQYTCDDVNIFDVTSDGLVLKSGATLDTLNPNGFTWKIKFKDTSLVQGSEWFTYTIKAGYKNPLEDIELNLISRTLTPDEPEYQLKTILTPENAYVNQIKYKSSDESVATVSEDGIISAVNNGEAIITVTVIGVDKEFTEECSIEVKDFDVLHEAIIEEDSISLELRTDDKYQLTSKIYPATVEEYTESWRSSDENICTVSDKGIVSCVNAGNAIVTYTVSQGDTQVMDTVNVEVIPKPAVSSPETWKQGSGEDLKFDFIGCEPDENTVVTVQTPDGRHELVTNLYYYIENTSLIVKYNYLMTIPEGDTSFEFSFTEIDEEQTDETKQETNDNIEQSVDNNLVDAVSYGTEETEIKEVPVPKFTAASSNGNSSKKYSLLKTTSGSKANIFSKVDSTTDGESYIEGKTYNLKANIVFQSASTTTVDFKPGFTYVKCEYKETETDTTIDSYSFVYSESSEDKRIFQVSDCTLSDDKKTISFIIESNGQNTPTTGAQYVKLSVNRHGQTTAVDGGTWYVKGSFENYSISLTDYAEIFSDSQSKCNVSATLKDKDGNIIDVDKYKSFLENYSIIFKEVDNADADEFNGWAHYFSNISFSSDYKNVVVVANREGTGYFKAYIKLRNINPDYPSEERISICDVNSSNACAVKNVLYTDVTKSNINHQWAQNSTVNLTYSVQGDFAKFSSERGDFTDNNVYLWYKKGNTVNRLKMSLNHFKIEKVNDNLATVTINYNFLRRLHLGSYPLYIVFKYDGSDIYRDRWSERGNYILTTFTIVKAGTPITGDEFNPIIWGTLVVFTIPATLALAYTLKKKKYTVLATNNGETVKEHHQVRKGTHEVRRGSHEAKN